MAAGELLLGPVLAHGAGVVARATILLLGALVLVLLLRRSSAGARHALWTVVLSGLLVLPAVMLMAPSVPVSLPGIGGGERVALPLTEVQGGEASAPATRPPVPEATGSVDRAWGMDGSLGRLPAVPGSPSRAERPQGEGQGARDTGDGADRENGSPTFGSLRDRARVGLAVLWLLGFTALLGCLLTGVVRARALLRTAVPVSSPEWEEALARALTAAGFRRIETSSADPGGERVVASTRREIPRGVSLRLSPEIRTPLAGGLLRSVIVLPDGAREWSPERRELVLLHELIHLRRKDPLRLLVGRLALAVYWFHPLAWIAARSATLAREEACDEEVVALGHRPSTYAGHLLALAEPDPLPIPAFSRIDRPPLEKRVMSILRAPARRRPFVPLVAAVVGAAWAFTVAASTPAGGTMQNDPSPVPALPDTDTLRAPAPPSSPAEPPPGTLLLETSEPPPDPGHGLAAEGTPPDLARTVDSSLQELPVPWNPDPRNACRPRAGGPDFEDGRDFEGVRGGEPGILAVWSRGDRFVQRSLEGFMLCIRIRGEVAFEEDGRIRSLPEGAWVVLAVRNGLEEGEVLHRLEIVGGSTGRVHSWYVAGEDRPFDDQARRWMDAMFGVFGRQMAGAALRGEAAAIREEMAGAREEEARLRRELARARGEEAGLRGEFAGMWGEQARLGGELNQVRAGLAALQQRLSTLESARKLTEDPVTRARLAEEAEEVRARLRAEEGRLAALEAEAEERVVVLEEAQRLAGVRLGEIRAEAHAEIGAEEARLLELIRRIR